MEEKIEVHHLIILDKSSSMDIIQNETVTGFNEVVDQIQEDAEKYEKDQRHFVSLITFNGEVETSMWKEFAEDVKPLTTASYIPNGSTALNDAIGASINRMKLELGEDLNSDKCKIQVTVISDGGENSSKEYTEQTQKDLVKELDATEPWMFNFIGANQDAKQTASARGFQNSMSFAHHGTGTQSAFQGVAETSSMRNASYMSGMSKRDTYAVTQDCLDETEVKAMAPEEPVSKIDTDKEESKSD